MNAEQLSLVGEKLVKRCDSRDPFEIAAKAAWYQCHALRKFWFPEGGMGIR